MSKDYKLISRQIKDIKVEDDKFIILVYSNESEESYYSPIVKGSVLCNIETLDKKTVPISYLENNDLIKIKIKDNIIIKIYINTKFEIILESSEEEDYL
jgi:hypothetical protein